MDLSPTAQGIVPVCNVDKPVGANRNLKPANPFREPALRKGWLDRADGQIVKSAYATDTRARSKTPRLNRKP